MAILVAITQLLRQRCNNYVMGKPVQNSKPFVNRSYPVLKQFEPVRPDVKITSFLHYGLDGRNVSFFQNWMGIGRVFLSAPCFRSITLKNAPNRSILDPLNPIEE